MHRLQLDLSRVLYFVQADTNNFCCPAVCTHRHRSELQLLGRPVVGAECIQPPLPVRDAVHTQGVSYMNGGVYVHTRPCKRLVDTEIYSAHLTGRGGCGEWAESPSRVVDEPDKVAAGRLDLPCDSTSRTRLPVRHAIHCVPTHRKRGASHTQVHDSSGVGNQHQHTHETHRPAQSPPPRPERSPGFPSCRRLCVCVTCRPSM
jgi:hypothetical protein